ncbi:MULTISPECIES: hypothetical protein [unclassified Streptomyces]|uniref:hypothetical protein n=1 Tax=unclassified Streptomyces TaxID=2593676 RepID=UPI0036F75453
MKIRRVDPRDTVWEQDHARYRVHFWDVPRLTAHEFEIAEESDADAVLAWPASTRASTAGTTPSTW